MLLQFNKFHSGMRAQWNTCGRVSQAWNLGYQIDELVHVQLLEKLTIRNGLWGCCQVCQRVGMTILHMHKVFPLEEGSRWSWHHLVVSLSFSLCRGLGVYKGECAWAGGWLFGSFGSCTSNLPLEKPLILCHSYFSASQGVRVQLTGKCSSFVLLHVPHGYLGYPLSVSI